jgi:hypothetical protein
VGFGHITGEVKKMLTKILSIDQDNYPEMLGHTCIINAGSVVTLLFRFIKPYLDIRTQNKIEVGSSGLLGLLLVGAAASLPRRCAMAEAALGRLKTGVILNSCYFVDWTYEGLGDQTGIISAKQQQGGDMILVSTPLACWEQCEVGVTRCTVSMATSS